LRGPPSLIKCAAAEVTFVSARTLNHHLSAILSKPQVRTRQEAAGRAEALLAT